MGTRNMVAVCPRRSALAGASACAFVSLHSPLLSAALPSAFVSTTRREVKNGNLRPQTRLPVGYSSSLYSRRFWPGENSLIRSVHSRSRLNAAVVSISDAFDGGNGELVETSWEGNDLTVKVRIRPDKYTELEKKSHFQYFCFRSTLSGVAQPTNVKFIIANAGEASYAPAWEGFTTFASTMLNKPESWTRKLDSSYDSKKGWLSWTHTFKKSGSAYFSYFPPFSYERHLDLIDRCAASPDCDVGSLGQTLDGRELECVTVGTGPHKCWVIHRQHPGENMAEYFAEGLINRLIGLEAGQSVDGTAKQARDQYTFHIVPNMNPDGAVRGHLRTNACGANLNREWAPTGDYNAPTLECSPEVYHVLNRMDETGVDAFLDVHGDEELPFNFLAGAEGGINWGPRLEALHGAFLAAYERANSDVQRKISYEPDAPLEGKPNICSTQISNRFDCLSGTLEMPFKDCATNSDPARGWNPARARMLGASLLDALIYVNPYLRECSKFWTTLPADDAYVRPTNKYK